MTEQNNPHNLVAGGAASIITSGGQVTDRPAAMTTKRNPSAVAQGEVPNQTFPVSRHSVAIEEGQIQKKRQRSSLLFGGHWTEFIQFLAALAIFDLD